MNLSSGIIHIAVDIKLLNLIHAGMAELADALDLESSSRHKNTYFVDSISYLQVNS